MKRLKIGLLARIIIAITLGIGFGNVLPGELVRVSTRITSSILSPIARTTSLMQYMFIPGGMEI